MATLYHGTTSDFRSFSLDPPQRRDSGNLGRGVYLTADPERAMIYAEANVELWGGVPTVLEVEADLGNVAVFDRALMDHLRREAGITFPPEVWDHERSERLRWWFLDHGYDSVENSTLATEICVFDPARLRIVGQIPYVSSRDRLIRAYEEKLGKPWPGKRNPPSLALVVLDHQGRHFETGVPVTFRFVRNAAPSPYMGERFQQHIEPAGRYMTHVENPRLPVDPSGRVVFETGLVTFKSPVVLLGSTDNQGYGPNSWKARLADHYQATGLELSRAILADGHDGIVTVSSVRGEPYTSEIVDLGTVPRRNPHASSFPLAGSVVSGLGVKGEASNTGSIPASLGTWEELPGIRAVPMCLFAHGIHDLFYSAGDKNQALALASQIRRSGWVSPLIVVVDAEGPYVLEGAHRLAALGLLGVSSFPAMVVVDLA